MAPNRTADNTIAAMPAARRAPPSEGRSEEAEGWEEVDKAGVSVTSPRPDPRHAGEPVHPPRPARRPN